MKLIFEGVAVVLLFVFGIEVTVLVASGNDPAMLAAFNTTMVRAAGELLTLLNPFRDGWQASASAIVLLALIAWTAFTVYTIHRDASADAW